MNTNHILPLIFTASLVACGGDSKGKTSTGQLSNINVSGLSYQTDSQSGELVDGYFKFKSNETVHIQLSGQTLFSIEPGQGNITDLISHWPQDWLEFEDSFYSDDADDSLKEFTRMANVFQLLHNLDADNNSDNGFDVTAYSQSNFTGLSQQLETNLYDFYHQTLLQVAGQTSATRKVTPMTSVGHLFDLGNHSIAYEQRTKSLEDHDNDGTPEASYQFDYDDNGWVVGQGGDNDLDGNIENYSQFELNDSGLQVKNTFTSDRNSDGTIQYRSEVTTQYNDLNLIHQSERLSDYQGDGEFDQRTLQEYQYDAYGRMIQETYSNDSGNDGSYNSQQVTAYSYNDQGLGILTVEKSDDDLDGETDAVTTFNFTYDQQGNLIEESRFHDDLKDDSGDSKFVQALSYDEAGNELTNNQKNYDENDTLTFEQMQTHTYNDAGKIASTEVFSDYSGDGSVDFKSNAAYTYYDNGKMHTRISRIYSNGVDLSSHSKFTSEYNDLGFIEVERIEQDSDKDGEYDSTNIYRYSYTDQGNLLRTEYSKIENDVETIISATDYENQNWQQGEKVLLQNHQQM